VAVGDFHVHVLSKTDLDRTFVSSVRPSNLISSLSRLSSMCINVSSFLPLLSMPSRDHSSHWCDRSACKCDSPGWRWISISTFHVEPPATRTWVHVSVPRNSCAWQTYKSAFACRICSCCVRISDFLDWVNIDGSISSTRYHTPTGCDMYGMPVLTELISHGIGKPDSALRSFRKRPCHEL
jgi:hypothetical protein